MMQLFRVELLMFTIRIAGGGLNHAAWVGEEGEREMEQRHDMGKLQVRCDAILEKH